MWLTLVLLFHVLGFLSSINAVMETRTSQGAVAWVVSLNTFPYLAVPAYWVLGRSRFQGYVTSRQTGDQAIPEVVELARAGVDGYQAPEDRMRSVGEARATERLVDVNYLTGNEIELLIDGDATFDSILNGIDTARDYVLFQFFIVKDDDLGRRVKQHLIAKAKEGVPVYVLYDEVGSHNLPKAYKQEMRNAGVQLYDFHSQKGPGNRFQINFRNHRKLVVVDGHTAWIGGHNIGDEYLGKDPKFGRWRDTHVRIHGPAAVAAQVSFCEDWYWAAGELPELKWEAVPAPEGNAAVLIMPSGPADRLETAALMFVQAINSARERIWIASPYFVPDAPVISALQLAALRGVDVKIIIPDKPDHLLVYLAAFSYYHETSGAGIEIYRYVDGFLHQKVMLIDDIAATVGTANFDNRSFRLNFELTAVIAGEDFARQVETMLEDDLAKSRRMTDSDIDDRSFFFKLGVRLARLSAPIQ